MDPSAVLYKPHTPALILARIRSRKYSGAFGHGAWIPCTAPGAAGVPHSRGGEMKKSRAPEFFHLFILSINQGLPLYGCRYASIRKSLHPPRPNIHRELRSQILPLKKGFTLVKTSSHEHRRRP